MQEHYPLSPEELALKLNSARDAQAKRYKGIFEPIVQIARRAFAKRPVINRDEEISPSRVKEVAQALEAALVMSETASPDAEIALVVKNIDLSHFVGYMRAIDHYTRALAERNGKLIERLEEVNGRNHPDGKGPQIPEIAQARQDDYDPFAGQGVAREERALRGENSRERSAQHPWDIPMAERPENYGAGEAMSPAQQMRPPKPPA